MTLPMADTNVVEATWVLVVKSVVIFAVAFMIIPMLTLMERKVLGRFQSRYGPNRVGPYGLLQPAADAVKLLSKEGFRPDRGPVLLRVRLPVVLRPPARRLGVGFEVQLPRSDALCGAAHLLRGLDGPRPARADHAGGHAVAGRRRRGPGRDLVHRPPDRRLPDLHGRRVRGGEPRPVRSPGGGRRAGPGLPDRVRGDAVRIVRDGRVLRDVRDLG